MEFEVGADWSRQVVVLTGGLVGPVVLSNAVVSSCGGVLSCTVAVPSELARLFVEWVNDNDTLALRRIIDSPWANNYQYYEI